MRLTFLLFLLGLQSLVLADDQDEALQLLQAGSIVPLEQIIVDAKEQHGGHILEVELESKGNQYYYDIEMVNNDGVVWSYRYDATTGKLVRARRGD